MESSTPNPRSVQLYHLGFVLVSLAIFLFFTVMTATQLDTGKFDEIFFPKDFLIENFNRLRMRLGDRVFNQVLIGKNGWWEFTNDRNLDDYQNALRFSPESLEAIAENMRSCYSYAREHHITFLVVIAPNKASIYPEKLPDAIHPLTEMSRLDQLNDYLRTHGIPETLDLRPALREARQQRDVYYQRGTHWNEYGAYIAYETILNALSQSHPDVIPYPVNFFRFRYFSSNNAPRGGDIGLTGLIQANFLAPEPSFFITRNTDDIVQKIKFPIPEGKAAYHEISWIPASDLPSLMFFHDSFGYAALNDLLSLNFSRVSYLHRNVAPEYLNPRALAAFAPDIVIYEVVERDLDRLENQLVGCDAK